jgi:hypothetical protein
MENKIGAGAAGAAPAEKKNRACLTLFRLIFLKFMP